MQAPTPLIILGPGFAKEEFYTMGKALKPELFEKSALQGTGQVGMAGIQEAIKEGIAPQILQNTRVAYETTLVEELLGEIAKEGKYAYGSVEVENALLSGAVNVLLVTDRIVRERTADRLLGMANEQRAKIAIICTLHDAGKKLEGLGGIAALLRYRIG